LKPNATPETEFSTAETRFLSNVLSEKERFCARLTFTFPYQGKKRIFKIACPSSEKYP
jgi:hypothetical protein